MIKLGQPFSAKEVEINSLSQLVLRKFGSSISVLRAYLVGSCWRGSLWDGKDEVEDNDEDEEEDEENDDNASSQRFNDVTDPKELVESSEHDRPSWKWGRVIFSSLLFQWLHRTLVAKSASAVKCPNSMPSPED